jgi:hypothetical protein
MRGDLSHFLKKDTSKKRSFIAEAFENSKETEVEQG